MPRYFPQLTWRLRGLRELGLGLMRTSGDVLWGGVSLPVKDIFLQTRFSSGCALREMALPSIKKNTMIQMQKL